MAASRKKIPCQYKIIDVRYVLNYIVIWESKSDIEITLFPSCCISPLHIFPPSPCLSSFPSDYKPCDVDVDDVTFRASTK